MQLWPAHRKHAVTVASAYQPQYVMRKYYTTLPMNYDPSKPYPSANASSVSSWAGIEKC